MADALLISTKEAAGKLGISYNKLLTLVKSGKVPFVRMGRHIKFRPESLNAWLGEKEQSVQ